MSSPLDLSLSDRFAKERFTRAIKESRNIEELQNIAITLLDGWLTQKAGAQWILRESLKKPAIVEVVDRPQQ
jgi:hypothetical protein